ADCDIARRLGDERMLHTCTEQLTALAPDHYETRRARAAFQAGATDRWRLAFWVAFLLGGLATLVHAASRSLRRRALSATLALLSVSFSWHASAEGPPPVASGEGGPGVPGVTKGFSKWSINAADPMSSVPTAEQRDANPLEY